MAETSRGIQVRLACVIVVDLRGEEFQHPLRRLRRRREQRGGQQGGAGAMIKRPRLAAAGSL